MKKSAEIKTKQKSLSTSVKDGTAAGISASLGDEYITPYALALNAQPIHIGILNSVVGLLSPIGQYFGIRMMNKVPRKKIVTHFSTIQGLMWIPIAFLGFLFYINFKTEYIPWILIFLYTALIIIGGIKYPAWFSWIGDLIPKDKRGKYFSMRNKIIGLFGLIVALIASWFLDFMKELGFVILGFGIIFILAGIARIFSAYFLSKEYSPKFKLNTKDYFSFRDFLSRMDNFGKFAVYLGIFNLALMIASPFFSVYMLEELNFSYITFMLVIISQTIVYLLVLPAIGRFGDKYGNRKLTNIANFLIVLTPLLWIFLKDPIALIILPQITAGIASAAFTIGHNNFIYDSTSPKHRALCLVYANIIGGIGIFIGSILGGLIIKYFHPSSINPYLFLFGVAAAARFIVALIFFVKIKEVKKVKNLPSPSLEMTHPIKMAYIDFIWLKRILKT